MVWSKWAALWPFLELEPQDQSLDLDQGWLPFLRVLLNQEPVKEETKINKTRFISIYRWIGQDSSHLYTIDNTILEAGHVADDCLDFGGGDVLAAPAESVAGAVLEEEVTIFVHHQNVSRKEGGVAAPEHVTSHFLFGGVGIDVAVKVADRMVLDDHADEHAGLAGLAADAETVRSADRFGRILRHFDQSHRVERRCDHRNEANGANTSVEVDCGMNEDNGSQKQ